MGELVLGCSGWNYPDLLGGPVILEGHSYDGFVITNAGYNNNANVKGVV